MSLSSKFIHLCDITKQGEVVGKDPYGRPQYSDVTEYDIRCRVDRMNEVASVDQTGTDYIISPMMYLNPDFQVTAAMTISNIRDKEGNAVLIGSFQVDEIFPVYSLWRIHHYELKLSKGAE